MSVSTTVAINAPGVYDIPASEYHADPVIGGSLSSTGARRLLPPSCPALFRHAITDGQEHRAVFDFGHAAHALVLGVGAPITVVDADDWRTKAAQETAKKARADGATPLLRAEYEQVQAMAAALADHPIAGALMQPGAGDAEQTLVWQDQETGVWRRAMLDWATRAIDGRLIIVDYKTSKSAEPGAVSKALENYGYLQQAPWYLDGATTLGLAGDREPAFLFVFQEKTPPYLVTVAQPDPEVLEWGRRRNRKALDVYRRCVETNHWPGYADDVISVSLPTWATYQHQTAWQQGHYDTTEDLP